MINTSNEYKNTISNNSRQIAKATITLADRTVLDITGKDIMANTMKINDATSSESSFDIGAAIIGKFSFTLNNFDGRFDLYDFTGAKIVPYIGVPLSNTTEWIRKGYYNLEQPDSYGSTINLSALDNMSKFEQPYSDVKTAYPATLQNIVLDICAYCGVSINNTQFDNYQYVVSDRPDDDALSCLDMISYVAQIAGCFARINNFGYLELKWYNSGTFELYDNFDGGFFDDNEPYLSGDSADGGNFQFGIYTDSIKQFINTTAGMTYIRNNNRQDDGSDAIDGADWLMFDGNPVNTIYVNGNSYLGFKKDFSEDLKICRRDAAMWTLLRQEGSANGRRFIKIRWEGYSVYNSQSEYYKLVYEVFLFDDKSIIINIIDMPSDATYIGNSSINSSSGTLDFTILKSKKIRLFSDDSITWMETSADNTECNVDAGTFESMDEFFHLTAIKDLTVSTDYVVITGICVKTEDKGDSNKTESELFGSDGYVLTIENNPLIIYGKAKSVADYLGKKIVGLRFRPLKCKILSDPSIEAGDCAYVTDRKQNTYNFYITNVDYGIGSYESIKCSAKTPSRNSATSFSQATKTLVKSRYETDKKISNYELAVQQMNQLAANSFGFYSTNVKQEDGSIIAYRHDKPTLAESKVVYKSAIDGFWVTKAYTGNDSTTNWTSGFDSNGNAVMNILSVVGINFDWARGGTLTLGGQNNQNGMLRILDSAGEEIGQFGNNGITTSNLTCTGGKISMEDTSENPSIKLKSKYPGGEKPWSNLRIYGTAIKIENELNKKTAGIIGATGFTIRKGIGDSVDDDSGSSIYETGIITKGLLNVEGTSRLNNLYCSSLSCSGSKSRLVETNQYENRLLYCYETPTPMFGDIGESKIGDDGKCYIDIEPIFYETIEDNYNVFLQKYGQGDLWVSERTPSFFVINGTPGLSFCWELKAIQKDYSMNRLDDYDQLGETADIGDEPDYGFEAIFHVDKIEKEYLNYEES